MAPVFSEAVDEFSEGGMANDEEASAETVEGLFQHAGQNSVAYANWELLSNNF